MLTFLLYFCISVVKNAVGFSSFSVSCKKTTHEEEKNRISCTNNPV